MTTTSATEDRTQGERDILKGMLDYLTAMLDADEQQALVRSDVFHAWLRVFCKDTQSALSENRKNYERNRSKKVHKRSRAKRDGTVLRCPKCNSTEGNRVYHFSWSAITCQNCHEMVNKYDWDQEDT